MGSGSAKAVAVCTALLLFFAARADAAGARPPRGPHVVVTHHLLEAFPPVEPLPGGGYVAMGPKYMLVSQGNILRWNLLPIPRKPGSTFPQGVTWLGGGSHARFFLQFQGNGEKRWLGAGKGTGLVEMLPGPKFRFVHFVPGRAGDFMNSKVGVFPFGHNFILTFDSGRHLRPQPPNPKIYIAAAHWIPGGGGRLVVSGETHITMERLTGQGHLRLVWRKTMMRPRLYGPKIEALMLGRDAQGPAFFLHAYKRRLWLASNKNIYVVSGASGGLRATIPGRELAAPGAGLRSLRLRRHLPGWGRRVKPNKMPPWAWSGDMVATIIGHHLFVYDQQAKTPQLVVWTIKRRKLSLDFKIPLGPADYPTYVKTKQGLFMFPIDGLAGRVSFRQKKLLPIELRVHVPGRGPWDPAAPIPASVLKRLRAAALQLPTATLIKITKFVSRQKKLSPRQRLMMELRMGEAALKKMRGAAGHINKK